MPLALHRHWLPIAQSLAFTFCLAASPAFANNHVPNGRSFNGVTRNGVTLNGVRINGARLNGTQLENPTPTHGVATASAPATAGTTLAASDGNGNALPMVIVSRRNDNAGYKGKFYKDNKDVWWNIVHWGIPHAPTTVGIAMPATTPNACVQAVVAALPTCGTATWDKACVAAARKTCTSKATKPFAKVAYGDSICGYDAKGKAREAIFLGGDWDGSAGTPGAGGKIADAESGAISIGCRKVGAIAKCVDFGYKPWVSAAMDDMHQACVRMVRADFCGDGTPWTVDGNLIDIEDVLAIQIHDSKDFVFEATWSKNGATLLNAALDFRTANWGAHAVNPNIGMTFAEYQKTHPYCKPPRVSKLAPDPSSAPATYSLADTKLNKTDKLLRTKRPAVCPKLPDSTCALGL